MTLSFVLFFFGLNRIKLWLQLLSYFILLLSYFPWIPQRNPTEIASALPMPRSRPTSTAPSCRDRAGRRHRRGERPRPWSTADGKPRENQWENHGKILHKLPGYLENQWANQWENHESMSTIMGRYIKNQSMSHQSGINQDVIAIRLVLSYVLWKIWKARDVVVSWRKLGESTGKTLWKSKQVLIMTKNCKHDWSLCFRRYHKISYPHTGTMVRLCQSIPECRHGHSTTIWGFRKSDLGKWIPNFPKCREFNAQHDHVHICPSTF